MRGTLMLTWILIICLSQVAAQSQRQYYSETRPHIPKPIKVTNLHFFMHENLGGTNASAVIVAQSNITSNDNDSSVPFGTLFAVDDPLRIGPEPDSEVIGNAQGLSLLAGTNPRTSTTYFDFGFTTGKYNGSSISMFSRTDLELAVVGGRGRFRMATGFALLNPYLINATTVIIEFDVTLFHH
ncbi:hypothetical protein Golax_008910 [Gossypium laxum]|uniref:Dirigent protein n=1 Tax=Gossypium laxum TaxID=34288 RepID=A0A7J9ABC9_9ROSI|nr:hypothetical protein [Gossypium laxum]